MEENLLQTAWWGHLKREFGWEVAVCGARSTRVFRRGVGPFRIAYVPYGFEGLEHDLHSVVDDLRACGQAHIVRWDIPWEDSRFDRDFARSLGLCPAPVRVQPPDTVILDLRDDEDALLGAMKPKTRYNIRLAARRGVTVSRVLPDQAGFSDALAAWYRIYQETARRDRIGIHPRLYYQRILELSREPGAPLLQLYLAHHQDDLLGGVIVSSWRGVSTYMYGAGADIKRNLMASYLLQWEAVRDAVVRGDVQYDFFGIPPADDPNHSMHGLYRFKTGFGGRIVRRPGAWDLVSAPVMGGLYRKAERVRRWYHHDFRKRSVS